MVKAELKISDADELRRLLMGMRDAYARGENVMGWARRHSVNAMNTIIAILVAYDLQAGSYVAKARINPEAQDRWCRQLAAILDPLIAPGYSLLEVGCGEATTLRGILSSLNGKIAHALGFDISWSRVAQGLIYLTEKQFPARLFVADLFEIPLADESIDIVYTSHSIEPNGGCEQKAIKELLRVARRAVVLVEPIYELANEEARRRMEQHGYVRGLKDHAKALNAHVTDYRLLPYTRNSLNPSGLLLLEKDYESWSRGESISWQCPLTHTSLTEQTDVMFSRKSGLAYPILRGIPLLRMQHAIVASKIEP